MVKQYPITHLFNYPLKSGMGYSVDKIDVLKFGFMHDRFNAIIDTKNRIITGRNFPKLLSLAAKYDSKFLTLIGPLQRATFQVPSGGIKRDIRLFRNNLTGMEYSKDAHNWISEYLKGDFRLVHIGDGFRPVSRNRGGLSGEHTAFADSAPVHLINRSSVDALNVKLIEDVGIENFRPNIVISGAQAFEEDEWSFIEINGISFRVMEKTQRCIFTTIHPETLMMDRTMEPLATIAKIRFKTGSKPTFGINLIPLSEGRVKIGDHVEIRTFI